MALQLNRNHWPLVALILATIGLFGSTFSQNLFSMGDSDEVIALASLGGVLHPPGYPIYNLLVKSMMMLVPWGTLAAKAHLTSLIFETIAIGLIYLISLSLIELASKKRLELSTRFFVALGCLLVATNFLIWQYAVVAEVFPLSNALSLLAFYTALKLFLTKNRRWWFATSLAAGLAWSHHQLSWLLLPGWLLLILPTFFPTVTRKNMPTSTALFKLKQGRELIIGLVIMVAAFGSAQVVLLSQSVGNTPVSWQISSGLAGWWHFFSRQIYGGSLASGQMAHAFWSGLSWQNLDSLQRYLLVSLPDHFGYPLLILAALGIYWSKRRLPRLPWLALMLTVGLTTLGVGMYVYVPLGELTTPEALTSLALTERMYLLGYHFLGIYIALGSYWLWQQFRRRLSQPSWLAASALVTTLGLLVLWQFKTNFSSIRASSQHPYAQSLADALTQLPEDSLVLCFSDASCFSSLYYLYVEKIRPDIQLLAISEQLKAQPPPNAIKQRYPDNPLRLSYTVAEALDQGRSVFVAEILPLYQDLWGLDGSFWQLDSGTIFQQLYCSPKQALEGLSQASSLDKPKDHRLTYQRLHFLITQATSSTTGTNQEPLCLEPERLQAQLDSCADIACRLRFALWSTLAAPSDADARLQLAQVYEAAELQPLAKREYVYTLQLDNTNATASAALQRLTAYDTYPLLEDN